MTFSRKEKAGVERCDTVNGIVSKETAKGVIVSFQNECGECFTGFAYISAAIGTALMCSVRKIFEDGFIILSVDSVLETAA